MNTSRGPVVDEAALADALASGEIFAAGLDVFEREPQVEPRLLDVGERRRDPAPGLAPPSTRATPWASSPCAERVRGAGRRAAADAAEPRTCCADERRARPGPAPGAPDARSPMRCAATFACSRPSRRRDRGERRTGPAGRGRAAAQGHDRLPRQALPGRGGAPSPAGGALDHGPGGGRDPRVHGLLPAGEPGRGTPPGPHRARRSRGARPRRLRSRRRSGAAAPRPSTGLSITPVLTAHPTKAKRRAVVEHLWRIAELFDRLQDPRAGADEAAEARRRLSEEIAGLWCTDPIRRHRPEPLDEVRADHGAVRPDHLHARLPLVYREVDRALRPRRIGGARRPLSTPFLSWGTWVGGDRDGNPSVTADVTLAAVEIQSDHVLRGPRARGAADRALTVRERHRRAAQPRGCARHWHGTPATCPPSRPTSTASSPTHPTVASWCWRPSGCRRRGPAVAGRIARPRNWWPISRCCGRRWTKRRAAPGVRRAAASAAGRRRPSASTWRRWRSGSTRTSTRRRWPS